MTPASAAPHPISHSTVNLIAEQYDLIVIGSGSGNSLLDERFSSLKVALLDADEHFGGTCLNYGCIPTKMLVRPARAIAEAARAQALGVHFDKPRLDWDSIRNRVFGRTDSISAGGLRYRVEDCPNITVIRERFRFVDRYTLESVSGHRISASKIVIAAGSRPRTPPGMENCWNDPAVYSSAKLMRIPRLPGSLVILGGGVVAVEFAAIFAAFGVSVTTVNRSTRLLSTVDTEVSQAFTGQVPWEHVGGVTVVGLIRSGEKLLVQLSDGKKLEAEAVLVAQGRQPNTDLLCCGEVGFDVHRDGRLSTDSFQRVLVGGSHSQDHFALGDISDPHQLKHVANHQARIVANNLAVSLGLETSDSWKTSELEPVVGAIFSEPEVCWMGENAAEARARGVLALEIIQDYADTAYGWALALEPGQAFVKLVVEQTSGRLLGATIIGPEAAVLIQTLVQAAALGHSVKNLAAAQYWPHPALSEVVENALIKAEKALTAESTSR